MKYTPILILLCSYALSVSGQINTPFEPVEVILSNNTKVSGQIRIIKSKDYFKHIFFKASSGEAMILKGTEVESITVAETGQKYVSYQNIFRHISGIVPKQTSDFYKVLVEGKTSLYYTVDSMNYEFYLIKIGNKVFEFRKHNKTGLDMKGGYYYNNSDSTNSSKENEYLAKCISKDQFFTFSKHAFIKQVEDLNACMDSPSKKPIQEKTKLYVGGLIGYSSSLVTFSDKRELSNPYGYISLNQLKGFYDLKDLTAEKLTQSSVFLGVSISVFPVWNKHFSFDFQPLYINRKWSSTLEKFDMESSFIEIPSTIKMNMNIKNSFQPFIGIGINPVLAFNSSYQSQPLTIAFNAEPFPGSQSFPQIKKVEMPIILEGDYQPSQLRLLGSIGFDYFTGKIKIGLNYRYDFLGSLTDSELYNTSCSTSNFYLTIGGLTNKAH